MTRKILTLLTLTTCLSSAVKADDFSETACNPMPALAEPYAHCLPSQEDIVDITGWEKGGASTYGVVFDPSGVRYYTIGEAGVRNHVVGKILHCYMPESFPAPQIGYSKETEFEYSQELRHLSKLSKHLEGFETFFDLSRKEQGNKTYKELSYSELPYREVDQEARINAAALLTILQGDDLHPQNVGLVTGSDGSVIPACVDYDRSMLPTVNHKELMSTRHSLCHGILGCDRETDMWYGFRSSPVAQEAIHTRIKELLTPEFMVFFKTVLVKTQQLFRENKLNVFNKFTPYFYELTKLLKGGGDVTAAEFYKTLHFFDFMPEPEEAAKHQYAEALEDLFVSPEFTTKTWKEEYARIFTAGDSSFGHEYNMYNSLKWKKLLAQGFGHEAIKERIDDSKSQVIVLEKEIMGHESVLRDPKSQSRFAACRSYGRCGTEFDSATDRKQLSEKTLSHHKDFISTYETILRDYQEKNPN